MKSHTTNYKNTFIEAAEDSKVIEGKKPFEKDTKTLANIQFDLINKNPYKYTSDDIIFKGYAIKNDLSGIELKAEREKFFSKGQPCLRTSPLAKTYGWGFHHNESGKVAMYGIESDAYKKFQEDENIEKVRAMRSKKK